jgi:hypothetical protein
MAQFIESLESRTFLSADPALAALLAEGKALIASTVTAKKGDAAVYKTVAADLKAADELKSSNALLKTLTIQDKAGLALTSKGVAKAVALVKKDVNKGIALVKQLSKKPGNATLTAKLSAAITTLQTDAANSLATINTDLTTSEATDSTNLSALVAANPTNTQLSTDASTTIPNTAGPNYDAIGANATTALTTDVDAIIAEAQSLT